MKMPLKIFTFIILLSWFGFAGFAQDHSKLQFDCSLCHDCSTPTKSDPCLIQCPKEEMVTLNIPPEKSPRLIQMQKLDETQDLYEPVIFSHRVHAEMSEMAGGCEMCHHYNPPGNVVLCSHCHEVKRNRSNISIPDLKAAYHRKCIDCHSQWSDKVECENCHELNESGKTAFKKTNYKDERVHPEIEIPAQLIYKTPKEKGSLVTFYHNDHTELFGFDCVDCHQEESCASCHVTDKSKLELTASVKIKHKICSSCHNTNDKSNCIECHTTSVTKSFNHLRSTGFELKSYHLKLNCIECHESKKEYTGLSGECSNCHSGWDSENFNHEVTGLVLDEMHVDFECIDCHPEENFAMVQSCEDCHDDKVYPEDKPGKLKK